MKKIKILPQVIKLFSIALIISGCSTGVNAVKVSTTNEFIDAIESNKKFISAEGYLTTDNCVETEEINSDVCFVSIKKTVEESKERSYAVLVSGVPIISRSEDWDTIGSEILDSEAEFLGVPIGTKYTDKSNLYNVLYLPSLLKTENKMITDYYVYQNPNQRMRYDVIISGDEKLNILFKNDNGDITIDKIKKVKTS